MFETARYLLIIINRSKQKCLFWISREIVWLHEKSFADQIDLLQHYCQDDTCNHKRILLFSNCHWNRTYTLLLSETMGCQQSRITRYSELTEEDLKSIPHVFRDINRKHMSPGVEYWFRTCFIQEGTLPLDVHVADCMSDITSREKQSNWSTSVSRNMGIILLI